MKIVLANIKIFYKIDIPIYKIYLILLNIFKKYMLFLLMTNNL